MNKRWWNAGDKLLNLPVASPRGLLERSVNRVIHHVLMPGTPSIWSVRGFFDC